LSGGLLGPKLQKIFIIPRDRVGETIFPRKIICHFSSGWLLFTSMQLLQELGTDNVVHDRGKVLLLSCLTILLGATRGRRMRVCVFRKFLLHTHTHNQSSRKLMSHLVGTMDLLRGGGYSESVCNAGNRGLIET